MNGIRLSREWTPLRVLAGMSLCVLGVLATLDVWRDIIHIAMRDEEASHIFLVPIVFGWLIWVRRRRLRFIEPKGSWIGPLMALAGWVLYDLGDTRLWQSVWHLGGLLVVLGCAVTVWGRQLLVQFLPAVVVLVFLIPVPGRIRQQVAIPLQTATAQITQQIFELFGTVVDRSGNMLSIKGVDVAIAEACNGLRMMFALALVSYAFAFGNPLRNWVRFIVIAASPISAIVCNVVRLIPTVWIYGNYSHDLGDKFHNASGWVMLFVSFLILMGIIRLLRWALVPVTRYTLAYD